MAHSNDECNAIGIDAASVLNGFAKTIAQKKFSSVRFYGDIFVTMVVFELLSPFRFVYRFGAAGDVLREFSSHTISPEFETDRLLYNILALMASKCQLFSSSFIVMAPHLVRLNQLGFYGRLATFG